MYLYLPVNLWKGSARRRRQLLEAWRQASAQIAELSCVEIVVLRGPK